jgi:molybdopterin molybdotransferase
VSEPYGREGLPLEQARRQVLAGLTPLEGVETVPLAAALGRVSAEPVVAGEAVPGFRASIMDGYAIADTAPPEPGALWPLVGRAAAGAPFDRALAAGEAIRILTGAPLPEGAQRVLPQELVERLEAADRPLAGNAAAIRLARPAGANPWIR